MNDWTDFLLDSRAIRAIFDSVAPPLNGVTVDEIVVQADGPQLKERFDLNAFPDSPPKKWLDQKCNRIKLTLLAGPISELSLTGAGRDMRGDISLRKTEGGIEMSFTASEAVLNVKAQFLSLNSITAYLARNDEEPGSGFITGEWLGGCPIIPFLNWWLSNHSRNHSREARC